MSKSTKVIRVSEDVLNALVTLRDGFETPNQVLERILLNPDSTVYFQKEDLEEPRNEKST